MREKLKHALISLGFRLFLSLCGGFIAFLCVGKLILRIWGTERILAHGDLFLLAVIMAGVGGWMITYHFMMKYQRKADAEIAEIDRQIEESRRYYGR